MLVTLDASLTGRGPEDVAVRVGARLADALAALGLPPVRVWCGPVEVAADAVAGEPPFSHGAILAASPRPPWREEVSPRLVSIAGPDAGVSVALGPGVTRTVGAADWADPSLDAAHATATARRGGIVLADAGSTNGTRRWDGRAGHARRRVVLGEGERALLGRTVVEARGLAGGGAPSHDDAVHLDTAGMGGWWERDVTVAGHGARGAARAILLSRGHACAGPSPLGEQWERWLPPAGGGAPRLTLCPPGGTARVPDGWVRVDAGRTAWTVDVGDGAVSIPQACVSAPTAERLARGLARREAGHSLRWGDLASPGGAWGLDAGGVPWRPGGAVPRVLAAGAGGSGRTTLLATAACALALEHGPADLRLVLVGVAPDGPAGPLASLPHVELVAGHGEGERALSAALAAAASGAATLVVVDDAHLLGASALRALDEALREPEGLGVLAAADRAAGVFGPAALAAAHALVALRCERPQHSIDLVGVEDAALLPPGDPGEAVVREGGRVGRARVALPLADPSPAAWRPGAPLRPGRHLAEEARRRWG